MRSRVGPWIVITLLIPTAHACSGQPTCASCYDAGECGWCGSGEKWGWCGSGDASGPTSNNCYMAWYWDFCPAAPPVPTPVPPVPTPDPCVTPSNCGNCVYTSDSYGGCGWCGESDTQGSCMSTGQSDQCNYGWYLLSQNSCPTAPAAPAPTDERCSSHATCLNCIKGDGCGWCTNGVVPQCTRYSTCDATWHQSAVNCPAPVTPTPQDPCTVHSNCFNCIWYSSCGWCSNKNTYADDTSGYCTSKTESCNYDIDYKTCPTTTPSASTPTTASVPRPQPRELSSGVETNRTLLVVAIVLLTVLLLTVVVLAVKSQAKRPEAENSNHATTTLDPPATPRSGPTTPRTGPGGNGYGTSINTN